MNNSQYFRNPPTNALGPGLTDEEILAAVSKSGYPLQTQIVSALMESSFAEDDQFVIQEEWSFVDRDTKGLRNIDILARKYLWRVEELGRYHIRPELDMLIECKQSPLPYVFFLSENQHWRSDFPIVAGLAHRDIEISTDDTDSRWMLTPLSVLSLSEHPFVTGVPGRLPGRCMSFSKCVRQGKGVELSGAEPFNSLVLPTIKAMSHFERAETPPSTAMYYDCHLVVGVGLLDAPMVAIRPGISDSLTYLPWVRILRHEWTESKGYGHQGRLYALDVVHRDFFLEYLQEALLPFAREFALRVTRHEQVLVEGAGFVSGMQKMRDDATIETRLKPPKKERWRVDK